MDEPRAAVRRGMEECGRRRVRALVPEGSPVADVHGAHTEQVLRLALRWRTADADNDTPGSAPPFQTARRIALAVCADSLPPLCARRRPHNCCCCCGL